MMFIRVPLFPPNRSLDWWISSKGCTTRDRDSPDSRAYLERPPLYLLALKTSPPPSAAVSRIISPLECRGIGKISIHAFLYCLPSSPRIYRILLRSILSPRFREKFEAVENRDSLQVSRLLSSRKMAACPPCRSARSANESCPEGEKEAIEGGGDNRTEGGGLEWTRNEDRGEGGKKEEEEEEREKKRKKRKREPPTESPTKSSATCPSRGSTQIDAHRVGF